MSDEQTTAIEVRKPDLSIQQFGSREDVHMLAKRVKAMMPGGDNLTDAHALATAQYALAVGANPFRGEVYGYTDKKGNLQLTEGYKLLVRWAKAKCEYSEWFTEIDGLPSGAVGFYCHILRQDKHDLLDALLKAQMPHEQAMDIVTTTAGGVVRPGDGTAIPKGWTLEDVAKKRALKNALQKSHGAPSPAEIARESWNVNGQGTDAPDWQDVTPAMTPNEAESVAAYSATVRRVQDTHPENGDAGDAVGELFGPEAGAEYTNGVVEYEAPQESVEPAAADNGPNWENVPAETPPGPHEWTMKESDELCAWGRERTLDAATLMIALGVGRLTEYPGDLAQAKDDITKWVAKATGDDQSQAELPIQAGAE